MLTIFKIFWPNIKIRQVDIQMSYSHRVEALTNS